MSNSISSPVTNLHVSRGDPMSHRWANAVVDRLPRESQTSPSGGSPINRTMVRISNDSGSNRDIGELLALDGWSGPTAANVQEAAENALFSADDPVWHSNISKLVVLAEPIKDGEIGWAVISGLCVVKLDASTSQDFVMIDPDSVNQCIGCSGGIGRLLGSLSGSPNYGVVNLRDASNIFRYELNADFSSTTVSAELKMVDNTVIGTITLSDPDGIMSDPEQSDGDQGWCRMVGNSFYAFDAACP